MAVSAGDSGRQGGVRCARRGRARNPRRGRQGVRDSVDASGSPLLIPTRSVFREAREEGLVSSSEGTTRSAAERLAAAPRRLTPHEPLAVEAHKHRRTALVALRGELDLLTVSKVAEVLDGLELRADGVRHVVLDLRGLTFMDVPGLRELIRQNEYARTNHHNLAVVRGTAEINRLLELTGVEDLLVLVDDPDDLVAPPMVD
jgi:anti-sigma B factor antagonist